MASGVSNSELVDLQRTTLANLPNMEFEVALKYQEYQVVNQWFAKEKVQEDSGTSIERNIVLDPQGNARHVRLFQKTPINVADQQVKITAPWVQVQASYSIERRETLRNRKPAAYINLLKSRRVGATVDLANLLELRAFNTPDNAGDDLNPRGIPYWLTKVDANTVNKGDFVGKTVRYGDATTTTVKGGIDGNVSSNANWRNYAFTYDAVNRELVKRMRRAFHATQFKSPIIAKDLKDGPAANFRIYVGLDLLTELEELATQQNENIGADLMPFHGITAFRRVPLLYTPQLDADASAPIYATNHAKFFPIVLADDWMRESDPMSDVEQHNTITTYLEGSYQYFCTNLREAGFVGSKKPTA